MGPVGRIVATVTSLAIFGILGTLASNTAVLVSGKVAGLQFEASDSAYLFSQTVGVNWVPGVLSVLCLGSLILIWKGQFTCGKK